MSEGNQMEKKMPVVASIVLYKHTQQELQPTIDSLLSEALVETIILVDNAGCEWAAHINNPRIVYIKSDKNGGFGHGHNQAMAAFLDKCEYFIICNPDIEFDVGTVETLYRFAKQNQHAFLAPNIIYPNGEKQRVCRLLPTPANLLLRRFVPFFAKFFDKKYELHGVDDTQNFFAPSISGCFIFAQADLLKKVQGFDSRYFMYLEDVDLCRKVLAYTKPIFCAGATVKHSFAKGSYKNYKLLGYHIQSAIHYFNKWGWFIDSERSNINKKCLDQLPSITVQVRKENQ
ncbi:glycosyltransferase [Serratia sp. DD3]|uniref:glycosyltransferase n=1 Tax=Serratia sp. DD3 TaxID=1410619 RepID=UPI0004D3E065|nr:glycosyltransferase family 2 protein [Serratia sp. DD3]KEY57816.1 N-acetylglucosaminyl-diphospho-decaprenol L-rhamnosyltransferase [Serratia sp. DD3]